MLEHWFDRAVEDKLGQVIDKYRSQGKDIHNVGRLRERVAADLNALRGTPEWTNLKNRYEPPLQNRIAWCCVCEKPVNSGSVTAWIEDKVGRVYCSQECKEEAPRVFITLQEWKKRVKEKGSVTGRRKEYRAGELVDGEEFTLSWDEVKNFASPFVELPAPDAAAGPVAVVEDEILWD